jgi:hypothetical protein
MSTLLLDTDTWDLVVDAAGNIAAATAPYAVAQDVASAVKLFVGELWYDANKGVPYFDQVLGQLPPPSLLRQLLANAATTVPTVVSANVVLNAMENRQVTGQIQFTTESGEVGSVGF